VLEAGLQGGGVELASDEDEAAFTLFVFLPASPVIAFDDHVHAQHHISVRVVLERDDALESQDVRFLRLGDVLYPREEFRRVDFTRPQRYRLHRHIMDRRGVIVVVMMVMIAIRAAYMVVIVVMIMVVIMRMVMVSMMVMIMVIVIAVGA